MPKNRRASGGRPRSRRLPSRSSGIIWQAVQYAFGPRENLGVPSRHRRWCHPYNRTIRQDLADKSVLKVEAAWFLVQRSFEERLIERDEFLRLEAVLKLCDPQSVEHDVDEIGRVVPAGLFLSANLNQEVVTAISPLGRRCESRRGRQSPQRSSAS